MTIGELVKRYRKSQGLSMQAFAERCGLSRAYISILEKGINPTTGKAFIPELSTLRKIALATNNPIDTLLQFVDDNEMIHIPALTPSEQLHITKYRALTSENQTEIDHQIDFKLYVQEKEGK